MTNTHNNRISNNVGSVRFGELDGVRQEYLQDIRECSALTKPKVFPPEGYVPNSQVEVGWQSHGGRLVSNVVSQMLLILFPANMSFYVLDIDDLDLKQMAKSMPAGQQPDKSQYDMFREAFIILEDGSATKFESLGHRGKVRRVLEQIVIGGSSCFTELPDKKLKVYPICDWVCRRDKDTRVVEAVLRDTVSRETSEARYFNGLSEDVTETTVYTHCKRQGDRWTVTQYNHENVVLGTAEYTLQDFPFNFPVWEISPGDDYGTGLVYENVADFRTLETGTQILTEASQSMSKLLFLLSPNGVTKAKDIEEAQIGGIVNGDPEDVGVLSANKAYDFQSFANLLQQIKQDLDATFMMASTIRRDAERVTAEEIRRMAQEFEKSKGGIYTGLAQDIQAPIARSLLRYMFDNTNLIIPGFITVEDLVPIINTGLQGLGRTIELENLKEFVSDLMAVEAIQYIDMGVLITRMAALRGIVTKGLIRGQQAVMQEQQEAQMNALASQVAPEVAKGVMNQQQIPEGE